MGEGSKVSAVVGSFASPGIGILKSWQGIAEIILRVAVAVLLLVTAIAAGACNSALGNDLLRNIDNYSETKAAAGWLTFVGVIGLLYELLIILQRFINILLINSQIFILLIVDAIVHGVLVVGLFAGAVALASYVPDWQRFTTGNQFTRTFEKVVETSEATAVFAFFTMIVLIGATIFTLLGGLIFKWNPTLAKYSSDGGGKD